MSTFDIDTFEGINDKYVGRLIHESAGIEKIEGDTCYLKKMNPYESITKIYLYDDLIKELCDAGIYRFVVDSPLQASHWNADWTRPICFESEFIKFVTNVNKDIKVKGVNLKADCITFDGAALDGHQNAEYISCNFEAGIKMSFSQGIEHYTFDKNSEIRVPKIEIAKSRFASGMQDSTIYAKTVKAYMNNLGVESLGRPEIFEHSTEVHIHYEYVWYKVGDVWKLVKYSEIPSEFHSVEHFIDYEQLNEHKDDLLDVIKQLQERH